MKKVVILSVFFLCTITSCVSIRKQESVPQKVVQEVRSNVINLEQAEDLPFSALNGYFLKSNVKLSPEINFFTIGTLNKLKKITGITKTMSDSVVTPNFNDEIVIIIAMKPSKDFNIISIKRICTLNNDIYIDYEVSQKEVVDLGYFVSNVYIFKVQKPKIIINACFIDANKEITVLPFGNRNVKSPVDISDMLKNYTGVYKGTFPISNTENIMSVELNLKSDYTFYLKQTYLSLNGKTFESSGKWYPNSDLASFVLNNNKNLSFYFTDRNTIEKLSDNDEKINPGMYTLKK
ncbi:MAG: copper resistance protein NlpE [Endomicrobium sp.]|jgi:hypothetical protein|uniref:copper resistance protein NlpE N-terminal domain-containing protein n=1 Tax=Candidatus Endomicrobiellum cubanum TaxID=3242325 RepID=UPI002817A205|nr:copper resistance protein NlpE [Endomicrobium sp.]